MACATSRTDSVPQARCGDRREQARSPVRGEDMAAAVRLAPAGQETVKQIKALRPPATLAMGAGIGGQPQRAGRGDRAGFHPLDRPQGGSGKRRRGDKGIAPARPSRRGWPGGARRLTAAVRVQGMPRAACPGRHPAVARVGPQVPGFLMADDPADPVLATQAVQHLDRLARRG